MASQGINNFEVKRPQPFMLRDILPGPAWAPYQSNAHTRSGEIDGTSAQDEEQGSCVKGFLVGIGLEGATAFTVYGVWHLWHMIR